MALKFLITVCKKQDIKIIMFGCLWQRQFEAMINLHPHIPPGNRTWEFGQVQVNPTGLLLLSKQRWHLVLTHADVPD